MSNWSCGLCGQAAPNYVVIETHIAYHYKHLLDNHFWFFMKLILLKDKKWKKRG